MKYLGIDYGSKRIGLAISDEEARLAFPFKIIKNENNKNNEKLLKEIQNILKEKNIKNIVIGESLNGSGDLNKISKDIKTFASDLEKQNLDLEILFEKEWYSTVEARRLDNRKETDDSAAAIILQRYLDRINRINENNI